MKDTATVQSVEGDNVTLVCGAGEMCRSCKANSFCSAKTREVSAVNKKNIQLTHGDKVEFFLPPGRTILAGFMVLIFPLITFIIAFTLSGSLSPESGEGTRALYGLAGLVLGFGISFLFNKSNGPRNVPEIVRKIEGESSDSENTSD